jgi:hypothetical protein
MSILQSFGCPGSWVQKAENSYACRCPNGSFANLSGGTADCSGRSHEEAVQQPPPSPPPWEHPQQQEESLISRLFSLLNSHVLSPPDLTRDDPPTISGIKVPQMAPLSVFLKAADPTADIPCGSVCQKAFANFQLPSATPQPDTALAPGTNPFSGKTDSDYAKERANAERNFQQGPPPSPLPKNIQQSNAAKAGCIGAIQTPPSGFSQYDNCIQNGGIKLQSSPQDPNVHVEYCDLDGSKYFKDGSYCK